MISVICYLPTYTQGWDAIVPMFNQFVGMAYDPTRWLRAQQARLANQAGMCFKS